MPKRPRSSTTPRATTRCTTRNSGRLLVQSPALESLGLHYTPDGGRGFRDSAGAARHADRSRTAPADQQRHHADAGEAYLVQVGDLARSRSTRRSPDSIDCCCGAFSAGCWSRRRRPLAGRPRAGAVGTAGGGPAGHRYRNLQHGCRCAAPATSSIEVAQRLQRRADAAGTVGRGDAAVQRRARARTANAARDPAGRSGTGAAHPIADEHAGAMTSQLEEFDRLTRLINQILTLARAEAGEIPIARAAGRSGARSPHRSSTRSSRSPRRRASR